MTHLELDGSRTVIANSFQGYQLNRPNVVVKSDGGNLSHRTNGEFAVSGSNAILQYVADLNPIPSGEVPRHALDRFDLRSQSRRVHFHQHRDRKHRCGPASAPGPQDAKDGQSGVAKVPRAESAVDLPCAARRLAIAVYRTC